MHVAKLPTSYGDRRTMFFSNDALLHSRRDSTLLRSVEDQRLYFVHSYRAVPTDENSDWVLATCGMCQLK